MRDLITLMLGAGGGEICPSEVEFFSFPMEGRAFLLFSEIEHCLWFMLLVCSSRSITKAIKAKRFAWVSFKNFNLQKNTRDIEVDK